ncbi:hypothetical protein SAMN05444146_0004 [Flavobacterium johnsoniae]|nr:hypothetical protein SAMN05444146_0004 [Flavobacterium johnsoniae]
MDDYTLSGFISVCFITFVLIYYLSFLLYNKNDKIKRAFYCSLIFMFFTLMKYFLFKSFNISFVYLDYLFLLFSPSAFLAFLVLLIKISKDKRKGK